MPPAPPLMLPVKVFALVKVKVSASVPPVKLPKLVNANDAVPSLTLPPLLVVMLQAFVAFLPINVFAPDPPLTVLKLLKVRVPVPSAAVPPKPWFEVELVNVTVVFELVVVKLLETTAPVADSI